MKSAKVGLIYTLVFILLRLSGEREFSVSLNKPYTMDLPVDMPQFSGTHADLLIIVNNKKKHFINYNYSNLLFFFFNHY